MDKFKQSISQRIPYSIWGNEALRYWSLAQKYWNEKAVRNKFLSHLKFQLASYIYHNGNQTKESVAKSDQFIGYFDKQVGRIQG